MRAGPPFPGRAERWRGREIKRCGSSHQTGRFPGTPQVDSPSDTPGNIHRFCLIPARTRPTDGQQACSCSPASRNPPLPPLYSQPLQQPYPFHQPLLCLSDEKRLQRDNNLPSPGAKQSFTILCHKAKSGFFISEITKHALLVFHADPPEVGFLRAPTSCSSTRALGLAAGTALRVLHQLSATLTPPTAVIFVEPEIRFRFAHCCKVRAVKSDLFLL